MDKMIAVYAELSGMTQYVSPDNKYLERFAQLIIEGCADVVDGMSNDIMCKGEALKAHFGMSDEDC